MSTIQGILGAFVVVGILAVLFAVWLFMWAFGTAVGLLMPEGEDENGE